MPLATRVPSTATKERITMDRHSDHKKPGFAATPTDLPWRRLRARANGGMPRRRARHSCGCCDARHRRFDRAGRDRPALTRAPAASSPARREAAPGGQIAGRMMSMQGRTPRHRRVAAAAHADLWRPVTGTQTRSASRSVEARRPDRASPLAPRPTCVDLLERDEHQRRFCRPLRRSILVRCRGIAYGLLMVASQPLRCVARSDNDRHVLV